MDTSPHTFETLFQQLGLASQPQSIVTFIRNHRLADGVSLEQAAFWSMGQAQFIHEAIAQDSDWAEIVDQLDARLRH